MRLLAIVFTFIFIFNCYCNDDNKRLVKLAEDEDPIWVTRDHLLSFKEAGVTFMDITPFRNRQKVAVPQPPPLPNQPQQKTQVRNLIPNLSTANMQSNVQILSSYHTRFYTTPGGTAAAEWIHSTVQAYSKNLEDISVRFFNSTTTKNQPSVIARIEGVVSEDVVILGSHEDSVNKHGVYQNAPGVDDDGSGTVCVLEVFRVLVDSNFKPNRTVEFHFYAAEEAGLLGSQAVANDYADNGVNVVGMMQLDMTFYRGTNDENIVGIVTDNTDPDLSAFVRELVGAYCDIPWVNTLCGYSCSDHASWSKEGYRSTFPFESQFGYHNPYIHSVQDNLEHADLTHGLEFAKLGLGFVVELAATDYYS